MIDDGARAAALASLPPDATCIVLATRASAPAFSALAAERAQTAVALMSDATTFAALAGITVLLEGLDDLDDPAALLRALAAARPARVLALVANAAFAPALDAFINGAPIAARHAFTGADLTPLFTAAGFEGVALAPIVGGTIGNAAFPMDLAIGAVKFRVDTPDVLARLSTAAYLVSAQPQ